MIFLRDKINLSETDARRYAKELASAEEKFRSEVKVTVEEELKKGDYAAKKDINDLKITAKDLETKISQVETKIEKGFKEVIIWVVSAMVAIGGLMIAIIKMF